MELFLHTTDTEDPQIIEVEETAPARSLLVEDDPEGGVWIEEIDEEIDLDVTLASAGVHHRHHVHRGHCRHIEVVVRWNGDHRHGFGPSRTIKTVEKWAFGPEVANFSKEQAAKHVLAVPGADHFLDPGVHIGSLTKPGECSVMLDLLPRSRFEG